MKQYMNIYGPMYFDLKLFNGWHIVQSLQSYIFSFIIFYHFENGHLRDWANSTIMNLL